MKLVITGDRKHWLISRLNRLHAQHKSHPLFQFVRVDLWDGYPFNARLEGEPPCPKHKPTA